MDPGGSWWILVDVGNFHKFSHWDHRIGVCLILGMGDGIIKSNLTISAKIRDRLEYLLIYLSYLLQQFSLPVAIATPLWAHCCQTFDVDSGPGASYFTFDRQKETHWKCLAILNCHLVMGKKSTPAVACSSQFDRTCPRNKAIYTYIL